MPDFDGAVLGAGHDDRELRVAAHGRHVVRVPFHRLHALLRLVVPHLDGEVICARDKVRPVAAREVVDAVDALLVPLERKVRRRRANAPHLDAAVERSRCERVRVLGVEGDHHDVVAVALVRMGVRESLVPVPHLDGHVVRRREHQRLVRVNGDAPDVVRVCLEGLDLLHRVVVVHADLIVVGARDDPLLARHEFGRAHRLVRHLEGLDQALRAVVPQEDVPIVHAREHPRLIGVDVDVLDAVGARGELALDVEAERHGAAPAGHCARCALSAVPEPRTHQEFLAFAAEPHEIERGSHHTVS